MDFATWLSEQLNEREWSQGDLVRAARQAGYKLGSGQLSYILTETRRAGPDACIAIAAGLELPREEVFRARGWLLKEPERIIPATASPLVIKVFHDLTNLNDSIQNIALKVIQAQIDALVQASSQQAKA